MTDRLVKDDADAINLLVAISIACEVVQAGPHPTSRVQDWLASAVRLAERLQKELLEEYPVHTEEQSNVLVALAEDLERDTKAYRCVGSCWNDPAFRPDFSDSSIDKLRKFRVDCRILVSPPSGSKWDGNWAYLCDTIDGLVDEIERLRNAVAGSGFPEMIKAPFTPAQIERLNRWQQTPGVHPYTCPGDRPLCQDNRDLIARREGWICTCGQYTQDWAWGTPEEK